MAVHSVSFIIASDRHLMLVSGSYHRLMVVAVDILVFIVQLIRVSAHNSPLEALPLDEWKRGLEDYPART